MKKVKNILKRGVVATLTLALVFGVTACGKVSASDGGEKKTIIVGTGNSEPPYCFLDDSGELTGYEKDVIDALIPYLPEYNIEIEQYTWFDIFTALETDKIDVIAYDVVQTDERSEKYLFGTESYNDASLYLVVRADSDIQSIADVQDGTIHGADVIEFAYAWITEYAEQHPEQNISVLADRHWRDEVAAESFRNGSLTGILTTPSIAALFNKQYGEGEDLVKVVGEPLNEAYPKLVFQLGDEETRDAFDVALKKIKDDGTLAELQQKWFVDYISEHADELKKD